MTTALFHDDAQAEFDAAIAYYEEKETGLGLRLHAAVEHAIDIIRRHPRIGAPYKETSLRRFVIAAFPFLLFYLHEADIVWIVAVAHSKRRPDHWAQRAE